jgi:type IV secretory pathway VirJ component
MPRRAGAPRTARPLVARAVAALAVGLLACAALACGCGSREACAASAAAAASAAPGLPERLNHGRFQNLAIYAPGAMPKSLVLFLADDTGPSSAAANLARELVAHGAMVAGIDLPKLAANLEADAADCVFLDGDLENLSHFLQAYYHLPSYLPPFLLGTGAGAPLAYASLVQAPGNTFAGALTLDFSPSTGLTKPLCEGSGLEFARRSSPGGGFAFLPAKRLENPWVLLQGERGGVFPPAAAREFIASMRGAALVVLPGLGHEAPAGELPALAAAFDTLVKRTAAQLAPPPPVALGDLPLIEVPAAPGAAPMDSFAIVMSGDGGWAGLDKDVAQALSARGVPVVGLDSLRYFWSKRAPEGLAADTDRLIRYYLEHLGKKRVLLVGYSQGADVLPFAVNRLPAATRSHVALTVLMGMSEHAVFEFHVSNWISDDNSGPATRPEVERMSGTPVLCIYGEGDDDSLCPKLDPAKVRIVKMKGGHHFDGDYAGLAREILASAPR